MKLIGIIFIVLGIVMIVFRQINFTTEKKVADLGPIEVNKKEQNTVVWPLYAGVAIIVCGVVVLIATAGNKKTS